MRHHVTSDYTASTRFARWKPARGIVTSRTAIAVASIAVAMAGSAPCFAQSFSNPAPILIPTVGVATPYPSTIAVAGVSGVITNLTVTLTNYSHTFPDDVDALLVGPQGQNVALMFGAGDNTPAANVTLTFSDAASTAIPNTGAITSGTYRPANYYPGDVLTAPAPAGPYGTTLSLFNGTDPNGAWKLYVQDMSPSNSGTIAGGWTITLASSASAPEPSSAFLALAAAPLWLGVRRSRRSGRR